MKSYSAAKVAENVYWVGAVDWGIRDFHGYQTPRGSTYNAYLVLADRVTLIDTVKGPFFDEMLARISSVVDPSRISYIISNHAEMDHAGALSRAISALNPEKVFTSTLGVKALQDHYHLDRDLTAMKDLETLSLGDMTLTFAEMRMLHWPESMATYLMEQSLLFSNDVFGMHLATSQRFDDEVEEGVLEHEAAKYYANILMPLGGLIPRAVEKVGKLGQVKMIAPSHGPIWRQNSNHIIELYAHWAASKKKRKAVVIYGTMWQSTATMAKAITEGLTAGGVEAKLLPLPASHRSEVAAEVLDAGALVVGSSTLNSNILPAVADVLTYLKGLKPKNLLGAAFGSYGWGGEAVGQIEATLAEMKVELVAEGVKTVYVPSGAALEACFLLGEKVAARLKEKVSD